MGHKRGSTRDVDMGHCGNQGPKGRDVVSSCHLGLTKSILMGLLGIILLGISGCGILGPDSNDDFQKARKRWEAAGIMDYDYVLLRGCFCADFGPKRVSVRDGLVASITDISTDEPFTDLNDSYPTISGLFAFLASALKEADEITISYDRTLGFPVSVSIDFIKDAIDDELSLTVSDFTEVGAS